jgi:hypothetical protein
MTPSTHSSESGKKLTPFICGSLINTAKQNRMLRKMGFLKRKKKEVRVFMNDPAKILN